MKRSMAMGNGVPLRIGVRVVLVTFITTRKESFLLKVRRATSAGPARPLQQHSMAPGRRRNRFSVDIHRHALFHDYVLLQVLCQRPATESPWFYHQPFIEGFASSFMLTGSVVTILGLFSQMVRGDF